MPSIPSGRGVDQPLDLAAAADLSVLREVFRRHRYTPSALQETLGTENAASMPTTLDVLAYVRRLCDEGPHGTLVRLLLLRTPVTRQAALAAFAPLSLEQVASIGLIDLEGDTVRSAFGLVPYEDLWFVSDRFSGTRGEITPHHVTGVNKSSIILDGLTIRRPCGTALDLGTGCGIQALFAARHARHVVATDLNPRALNLTAFNARLNGFRNIECRQGSLLEPVTGEKFDLIVTNPPFVISPESRFLFRDSGGRGDSLCEKIVLALPQHLNEGGHASMLANWVFEPDGDWAAEPRRWLTAAGGCDGQAFYIAGEDPLTYAATWIKLQHPFETESYDQALDRWLAFFRAEKIRAIAFGGIVARRRAAGNSWFQGQQTPKQFLSPCGAQIERLFRIQDYLEALPRPEALLDRKLRLADDHRLDQTWRYHEGKYVLESARLRLVAGLALEGMIDEAGVEFLAGCTGHTPLADLVRRLCDRTGNPWDDLVGPALLRVRKLMRMGFLVPVDLEES